MRSRYVLAWMIGTAVIASGGPALAQSAVEGRVDKLEREMRAVQRKVFPGGSQIVTPDITAPEAAPTPAPGTPATSPVSDLAARVSALEGQMTTLTGQIEQAQYRLRQIDEQFTAYKTATDARLKALEGPPAATASDIGTAPVAAPGDAKPPAVTPTVGVASPERAARVAAVEKPVSSDPAEDLYVYGFRLWQAKLYPEAEEQLKQVATKYPKHRRYSWAQNLLGRAYLDEGKPSLASLAFYDNYKKMPEGERAPDSLFYLAQALRKLKRPSADICKVYGELNDVYGAKIASGMAAEITRAQAELKCK